MTRPITRHRDIESLKAAAGWAGAEAFGYFQEKADAQPGEPLPLALAGYFQARLGEDTDAALAKLDRAASVDLGLPQYLRGLALASLPADPDRARQAIADLEFVLAVRDQFPLGMIRAAHC